MTEKDFDSKADIICGCSGTTVGQILTLIEQGTIDMDRISRITGVLSGCGGCEFDVQTLVNNHKDPA
jgi:NAD(P)H-nitrite reductase large subunit